MQPPEGLSGYRGDTHSVFQFKTTRVGCGQEKCGDGLEEGDLRSV